MNFSTQAFSQWLRSRVTQRDREDAHLTNAAWDAHQDDPAIGYRFISYELNHAGLKAGENRVLRQCSQQRMCFVFEEKLSSEGHS